MKPVLQEDPLGCAVACVACILNVSYQDALVLFRDGKRRARTKANFYCKEIVQLLNIAGLNYEYKYIKDRIRQKIYKTGPIVFIKRSRKYPVGHYLCRTREGWMDSWINFPSENRKAGLRKRLPGKSVYLIFPL